MKLYELSQNYNNLYDLLEDESIPVEVVEEALTEIEDKIDVKFENIASLVKSFEGKVDVYKNEEKRLQKSRRTFENKVKSLKNYMLDQLNIMDRTKVETNLFTIRKQKSPKSIQVYDPSKLDEKYLIPQEPKVNNKSIKSDLDAGIPVEGADYKPENYHIRIQ